MLKSISFRWDPELVARIDQARGDVPRSRWVRRAVEQALGGGDGHRAPASAERLSELALEIERNNARAREQAEPQEGLARVDSVLSGLDSSPFERRAPSSSQSKRDVRPIPKKGER